MKRFVLRTLLYMMPFTALLLYYLVGADHGAMQGDLGRMTSTEFHYLKPHLVTPMAECRNVEKVAEIPPLAEDEMVVFGDSFSIGDSNRWHQYMGSAMGRRIIYAGRFYKPVEDLIDALNHHPAALGNLVVLELVERNLVSLALVEPLPQSKDVDLAAPVFAHPSPQKQQSAFRMIKDKWRRKSRKPLQFYQHMLGIDVPVNTATLDTEMFSCRPNKLYYYQDDLYSNLSSEQCSAALRNLKCIDSIAGAKGIAFYLVAIPDKYTVYHRHIKDAVKQERFLESPCPFDTLPFFINTLPVMEDLKRQGIKDVYLPDDSHFSHPTACAVGSYAASRITLQP